MLAGDVTGDLLHSDFDFPFSMHLLRKPQDLRIAVLVRDGEKALFKNENLKQEAGLWREPLPLGER